MRPSERIKEILGNKDARSVNVIEAILQYLDEEWEKKYCECEDIKRLEAAGLLYGIVCCVHGVMV